jgi:signal transduction histidine kinase
LPASVTPSPPLREEAYLGSQSALEPVVEGLALANVRIEELVREGRASEADQVFGGTVPMMGEARRRLEALAAAIDEEAEGDFLQAETIIRSSRGAVLVLLLASGLLALLLALWAVRTLATPARKLAGAMAEVTAGTLEAPDDLPYGQKDEIGELCRSFRTMTHRLAELDRMKAEFLGVAGHELKTPITVIAAYNELIEEELTGELTEQQQGILSGIADQTRTLTRLVNRLMDISRLESGSLQMELEPVHLGDLLTGVVRSFEVVAGKKGVATRSEVEPTAPESVVLDLDLIRNEVLGNLVSNAVKFVPEGGEVLIRVRGEGEAVVIRVSDDGRGIPPEHRSHIFEKHYQVERSRKVGSGLGLAIAREVVELHGGSITLLDTPPPGAVFEVHLPIQPPG